MSLVIGKYASSREFRGSERIQALDDCGRLCKEMSASGQKVEMNSQFLADPTSELHSQPICF